MIQQAFAELSSFHLVFFLIAVLAVCVFEFVNGFHDTANAVATVIYTRTLRPFPAVVWSAIWNFLGVWLGGIAVAVSIINLPLPGTWAPGILVFHAPVHTPSLVLSWVLVSDTTGSMAGMESTGAKHWILGCHCSCHLHLVLQQ